MGNDNKKNNNIIKLKTYASIAKNDEYFTPPEAVYPIAELLKKYGINNILEPCDTNNNSNIAKVLREYNFNVYTLSIKENNYILNMPTKTNVFVVTNPPYSLKDAFIEKSIYLIEKNIINGFAFLLSTMSLHGVKRHKFFNQLNDLGFSIKTLIFDKRVEFTSFENIKSLNKPWFDVAWFVFIKEKELSNEVKFVKLQKREKDNFEHLL
ncbi:hypothetical protein [Brachyspira hyodysenteriae]|uniref:hypothetical protein n=1 Tax=Brachyspira hyodysenteriae TaxID=159 RepID=UPI00063DA403|nr:hypothetical protein [Brachyspira hyodysenteriae]KLI46126.1 hypothetical protein SZ41_12215 [Brachyspira hyodysenteriae]KLI53633.1 hypothetical protein SZ42_00650 [Brachyspira hyodysenteriae]